MNTKPRVSIIILNWNGWKDTIECLESVYQITYPNYDVIVVDNGSEDESLEKIKGYAEGKLKVISKSFEDVDGNKPLQYIECAQKDARAKGKGMAEIATLPPQEKLILIKNEKNYGFAEGNNIAIKYALKVLNPQYILLLNNDTVVERDFLDELVYTASSDKRIGFVGPKTYYYDYHGRRDVINFAGGKLIMWKGKSAHIGLKKIDTGQYDRTTDVDYIEGSCLLARRETLESVGLLDPSYFLYWEETDLCIRAQKAGYRTVYSSKAKIWHKVGASGNATQLGYFFTRNRFRFMKKYSTRAEWITFSVFFWGYEVWFFCAIALLYHRNFNEMRKFLVGIQDGLR